MNRLLLIACLSWITVNCASTPTAPVQSDTRSITLINRGGAVANPVTSTYIIKKDSVRFYSENRDSILESWSKPTVNPDFDSLMSLIYKENIIGMADPVLSDSQIPCDGPAGELLIIRTNSTTYSINISGELCGRVPANLQVVLIAIGSLSVKYEGIK
jgi:hypothetical protein